MVLSVMIDITGLKALSFLKDKRFLAGYVNLAANWWSVYLLRQHLGRLHNFVIQPHDMLPIFPVLQYLSYMSAISIIATSFKLQMFAEFQYVIISRRCLQCYHKL